MTHFLNILFKDKIHYSGLLLVLLLSGFLNTYNINFSEFHHPDEYKKVQFVLSGHQDFRHPILMLQSARLLNQVFGLTEPDKLIILCRMVSASCGVLLVLLIYLLSRQGLSKTLSLLVALGLAVSPIFVIHAHYFKEDLIFTACSIFSLLCFLKMLKDRSGSATILWGLATGLAVAAQYKGAFLILLYFIFPRILPETDRSWVYKNFRRGLGVMAGVFLLVNYPLFLNMGNFFSGLGDEVGHAIGGHTLNVYPFHHWFAFHLINSLVPGLTLGVTLLALGGLAITLGRWNDASTADRLLLAYTMVFYFVHEISPMKTFPDFMRYMIPIVPAMMYFACKAIEQMCQRIRETPTMKFFTPGLALVLTGVVLFIPGHDTWMLESNLVNDTRSKAQEWVAGTKDKVWSERYTLERGNFTKTFITKVDIEEARKAGVSYLLASSFNYERFFIGAGWSGQDDKVYKTHKKYAWLFSYPYQEIKPTYKTFAFSNPVVRIVDIRDPENREKPAEKKVN